MRCRPHGPATTRAKYIEENDELKRIIDQLGRGFFSPRTPALFQPILDSLQSGDRYCVLADYASYIACQETISKAYQDRAGWTRKAIINVARSGKFSSDRAVEEYARHIWGVGPLNAGGKGEDASSCWGSGSTTEKAEPLPGSLSTLISPPWSRTMP